MRVLVYLYYPFFDQHLAGGVQVAVRTLIHGFLKRGHQVRVLCPECEPQPLLEAPGLEVIPVLKELRTDAMPPTDISHNLRQIRMACEGMDVVWSLDRPFPAEIPQPIVLGLSAICYTNELDALFGLNWDQLVVPSDYVARVVDSWLPLDASRPVRRGRSCIPPRSIRSSAGERTPPECAPDSGSAAIAAISCSLTGRRQERVTNSP